MKPLSMQDASWLLLERRKTPMHIAGLSLFRLPEGASRAFLRQAFERHRNCGPLRAPFNQRLSAARLSAPMLEDDPEIDIDYHVRHSALPANATYRDLFVLVSRLHSIPLDRSRPLWEFHLIEGLPDRQYALYTKIHHALADGMAGVDLMHGTLSRDPLQRDMTAPWAQAADRRTRSGSGGSPRPAELPLKERLAEPLSMLPQLGRVAREMMRAAGGRNGSALRGPWQAPRSVLNTRLSGSRRVVCQSWAQTRLQAVGKALGVTLNDVVLAMCSGALRAYLQRLNALPAEPLICGVPVAIEKLEGETMGNAISMAFANLGTHEADPLRRLQSIRSSVQASKELLSTLTRPALLTYTTLTGLPLAFEQMMGVGGLAPPAFNLVVSNVPGPREPLYWNGARQEHVYPISLLPNGQALNISLMSCAGSLDFGLVGCRRSLPQLQRLIDHLEDALVELEQAAFGGRPLAQERERAHA